MARGRVQSRITSCVIRTYIIRIFPGACRRRGEGSRRRGVEAAGRPKSCSWPDQGLFTRKAGSAGSGFGSGGLQAVLCDAGPERVASHTQPAGELDLADAGLDQGEAEQFAFEALLQQWPEVCRGGVPGPGDQAVQ